MGLALRQNYDQTNVEYLFYCKSKRPVFHCDNVMYVCQASVDLQQGGAGGASSTSGRPDFSRYETYS